jgi:small subunit ribosomal protein S3
MEAVLGRGLGLSVAMYPYKSMEEEQTARFLSEEIAYYLERRVPFRRIKQALMRELQKRYIEGVKVSCSGRVGGRSKKAQRSREEGFQWGQTSSHVFSSKLGFASRSALTPFGKVGIKVWICYK